jgi:uncharacterized protein
MIRSAVLAVILAWAGGAAAQGLDCAKATGATERAICAAPSLLDQDRALAQAFAAALRREPARAGDLRAGQRRWLAERNRCAAPGVTAATLAACLGASYRARMSALGASPAAMPALPPRPGAPPQAAAAKAAAAGAGGAGAAILPAAAPLPVPAGLAGTVPAAEASLSRAAVPAAGRSDVLVRVAQPGRFAIRAESRTGVALQLVDMMTGPGDQAGERGVADGRLDVLLDSGTYKLRAFGAEGASGEARLVLQPFRAAAEISDVLVNGGETGAELDDLQQRSFWIGVPKSGRVSVEAVGPALGDLRLWRDGRDLAGIDTAFDLVEPKAGHPMQRARIDGQVEPGLYLATVYGGPPRSWADGDAGRPLVIRAGPPASLASGWAEGVIGASGSVRYEASPRATYVGLELPDVAPVSLKAKRGETQRQAAIVKNSREPGASVTLPPGGEPAIIEITGASGQPYRVRALDPSASRRASGTGPHWIAVDVAGEGAEEIPATALLAAFEKGTGRVLASSAPRIGPGQAWRRRLNIRGPSRIILEAAAAMPAAVRIEGIGIRATIEPLLGTRAPRADGRSPRWDLEPGWYMLRLDPVNGAVGVIDLTVGPPGLAAEPARPGPPRAIIPLGMHTLDKGVEYQVFLNEAPNLVAAPTIRALPADLGTAPLTLYQQPGEALEVPVRAPARGALATTGADGAPVPVVLGPATTLRGARTATLRLPAPAQGRAVVLSWSDPQDRALPPEGPAGDAAREPLAAGTPRFLDLGRDRERSFALHVPEGGLYRVETLGRLRTSLALSTAFLPDIETAEASGAGQNALLQAYLRAGRYRLGVKALASAGRLGVQAAPAVLRDGSPLAPGGSVRATLADGEGAVFPIEIAEAGRYRLDLYGLSRTLRARIEDEEGWPLTAPGPVSTLRMPFAAGRYRLVVLPEPVEARVVVHLAREVPQAAREGHGPHPLAFGRPEALQWREPEGRDAPRVPDRWEFALQGPADVTLDIGDGMVGDLRREGDAAPLARILHKAGFSGRLPAGRYAVEASSLGRNDRLDYTITLAARELQPGASRRFTLPAQVPFAIAEDRVVDLVTYGRTALRGTLRDAEGRVVERLDARADDWNVALARRLPAGAYTLDLAALDPGAQRKVAAPPRSEDEEAGEGEDTPSGDEEGEGEGESESQAAAPSDAAEEQAAATVEEDDGSVDVGLALPSVIDHPAFTGDAPIRVTGPEVHRFPLASAAAGLVLVGAEAGPELALQLEQQVDGRWIAAGTARGRAPFLAAPTGTASAWRASVWALDGGADILVAARVLGSEPQPAGRVRLDPVPLQGMGLRLRAGRVASPASAMLAVEGGTSGLLEGSRPGQTLAPPSGPLIVPQGEATWLLSRDAEREHVTVRPFSPSGPGTVMTVPPEGRAGFASTPPSGERLRLWRAESAFGQPGLEAGAGMGIARGSAVAVARADKVQVWNAGGSEALALRLSSLDVSLRPQQDVGEQLSASLEPGTARILRLRPGAKRVALDLSAGAAAVLGQAVADATTVWTGAAPVSRVLEGHWTELLLLNPGPAPGAASIRVTPLSGDPVILATGQVMKRFVGAAGSLSIPVRGRPGDRLVVAGADAEGWLEGADGNVSRGRAFPLQGEGRLTIEHGPGLIAAWIEGPGRSPWAEAEAEAEADSVTATLPGLTPLKGEAMTLALAPDAPVLLHARTSAPVILSLVQEGREEPPELFAAGAEFHRYLAAGPARLRLFSPQDGPLGGSLDLTATPVVAVGEGLGQPVAVAPGASALFGFALPRPTTIGIGIRAEPDRVDVRLLDSQGSRLGAGIVQMRRLEAGRYLVEARVPPDGVTTMIRPAVIGLAPPPAGPPPDVAARYLELVGLTPGSARRGDPR